MHVHDHTLGCLRASYSRAFAIGILLNLGPVVPYCLGKRYVA